ncbi:MAG TPA: FAD-dependent oxidoreductase [Hyphomicrobiaceae bacterium]|nr:FAD-dependent oxidoreductase [Hyphomicrobiaceae bacterium]
MQRDYDVAVVGGGLVGAALAWGLAREGQRVTVLDEGDMARRASRANFALVWVQSKGLGLAQYMGWTVRSSDAWRQLADDLRAQTGLDVCFARPGGFHLALGEAELAARAQRLKRLHNQPGAADTRAEVLDRAAVERLLPGIGPEVAGGSFCPLDGHVNSLRTLRAFHKGLYLLGTDYRPAHTVRTVVPAQDGFRLLTSRGEVGAKKVVLAAGNANMRLAPLVGLKSPMQPNRGQILVTERAAPFLPYPLVTIRQTDEGTVMIGDSREETTDETRLDLSIAAVEADRARRMFPALGKLNVIRTWSGIRVMTQDGFPIYDQSTAHPGAFVVTCHSGVTLAAGHALVLAGHIHAGQLPSSMSVFNSRRFHVPAAA